MKQTIDEFLEWLSTEHPDTILIGGEEERKRLLPAVVGFDCNTGSVIYSREKLIECFMQADNINYEEAAEWVEYNIDRALAYYPASAPIIMDDVELL